MIADRVLTGANGALDAHGGRVLAIVPRRVIAEGQRRFVVDVTLGAKEGDLSYSPEEFTISGEGVKHSAPIRDQLDSGTIPAGSAISGRLVFQVPEETTKLMLSFGDDRQKVALNLNESDAHSHGGAAAAAQSQAGEDHSHDNHHH